MACVVTWGSGREDLPTIFLREPHVDIFFGHVFLI